MSKHTPGPWEYAIENEVGKKDCRVIKANGDIIMCDTPYYPWCPNEDADWRLIAAAPALLEALSLIASDDVDFAWLRSIARAAIAKATGEKA